jgi:hypothetical protein
MHKMKIISKLLVPILLLAIAASPLRAQTNDSEKSETTNTADAVATSVGIKTNAIPDNDHPPVRIDRTGIHVGGKNPVDINLPSGGRQNFEDNWIPIVAIVMVFGMPIAIVGMFFYFRHRKNRMLHETLRAMVEKGVAIPPELLTNPQSSRSTFVRNSTDAPLQPASQSVPFTRRERNDLRNGLILTAVGGGVTAIAGKVGLIVLFIGIAMIIISLIDRKDRSKLPPENK